MLPVMDVDWDAVDEVPIKCHDCNHVVFCWQNRVAPFWRWTYGMPIQEIDDHFDLNKCKWMRCCNWCLVDRQEQRAARMEITMSYILAALQAKL